ncbi:hypothetical protein HHK36_012894 [Tetracentron sinense]|uniref:Ubiquitin-like domain-containing protein n=1 Tax=Tetracentron sinense TaxID=13715 RepID=A0A835DEY7_TETSI|nr:hypothetical protein HHK36_012894 [Tetracentron sinense]
MGTSAMEIFIKVASKNKTLVLEVRKLDTVEDIKRMIQDKEGIPVDQQLFIYNGIFLENHLPLVMYNIVKDSTLDVVLSSVWPNAELYLMGVDGKVSKRRTYKIDRKSWYSIQDMKAVVESVWGITIDQFKLTYAGKQLEDCLNFMDCNINKESTTIYIVVRPLSEAKKLEVAVGDIVHDIKAKNQDMVKSPWEKSTLLFAATKCEDGKIPYKNLCQGGDNIIQIEIYDYIFGDKFTVSTLNTVKDIKKIIENEFGVPQDKFLLFYDKNLPELENWETLSFYGIEENSTLLVIGLSMKLFIKMPQVGTTIEINLNCSDSIDDLKDQVWQKMGIPSTRQILLHAGRSLDDDQTLDFYNIQINSTLHALFVSEDGMQELNLLIKKLSGDTVELKVKHCYTILDVKAVIESMLGLPIGLQELIHVQEKLKDWKTLADYNIENESILQMMVCSSPLQLVIMTPSQNKNTNTIMLEAKTSNTIDEVMDMIPEEEIEKIKGHPCLFLDQTRLVGNQTLAHYDIQSGSFLSLERLIQVSVRLPGSATIKVDLKPSYYIHHVKEKIEEMCGIPCELQTLTYLGEELESDFTNCSTLGQYEDLLGSLWVLRWLCRGSSWSFYWPSYEDRVDAENVKDYHGSDLK